MSRPRWPDSHNPLSDEVGTVHDVRNRQVEARTQVAPCCGVRLAGPRQAARTPFNGPRLCTLGRFGHLMSAAIVAATLRAVLLLCSTRIAPMQSRCQEDSPSADRVHAARRFAAAAVTKMRHCTVFVSKPQQPCCSPLSRQQRAARSRRIRRRSPPAAPSPVRCS